MMMKSRYACLTLILTLVFSYFLAMVSPVNAYYEVEQDYDSTSYAPVEKNKPASPPVSSSEAITTKPQAAVQQPEEQKPVPLYYEVNAGDTLYKIAKSFNTSVESWIQINSIQNPGKLRVGQKLLVPNLQQSLPIVEGAAPVIQKVLSSTLTAYTAGVESTGKSPSHPQYGITYSGSQASEGRTIAVDPNVIPLGTLVYIEGIGVRKAEDTGSAIKGAKIDVFMEDVDQAREFGVKRNVKVYVLENA